MRFWISWYATKSRTFALDWPHWTSGQRCGDDALTICAAVIAEDADAAMEIVYAAHDKRPRGLEWRFVNERPDDWSPFCDRFLEYPQTCWPAPPPTNETNGRET